MRTRVLILLIILTGNLNSVFAQNETFIFKILDDKTSEPIQFCYVVIKGKNISSQSDEKGIAKIQANSSDTLIIYQLGYYVKKTTVNDISNNNNIALLKSKNITLSEVNIMSQKIDTFQNSNGVVFIDFNFYDDFILALVNKGSKNNSLFLLDINGNIVCKKNLAFNTEFLFKDCFENIHLITNDSVYQIYYNYKNIMILPPYHINSYYNLLYPCECYHGNKYIFKTKQYRELKNTYYLYEKEKNQIIACIADSSAISGFNLDFDLNYFLSLRRRGEGYETSVSEITKHIDEYRENLPLSPDYINLLRPIESEIKKIDTNFILIDYTNKLRYTFTLEGKLLSKLGLNNFNGITPKLYIDHDAHNLIFTSLSKSGVLTLFKYDNFNNGFTDKFELKNFYFIKNFKIKGNNLYFINKDRSSNPMKTKIVKEIISWQKL